MKSTLVNEFHLHTSSNTSLAYKGRLQRVRASFTMDTCSKLRDRLCIESHSCISDKLISAPSGLISAITDLPPYKACEKKTSHVIGHDYVDNVNKINYDRSSASEVINTIPTFKFSKRSYSCGSVERMMKKLGGRFFGSQTKL